MRIKHLATGAALVPLLLASSAMAAPPPSDIQIWSNEKELENGNSLILDADNTGGDVILQFGDSLGETIIWDDVKQRFHVSDDIYIEGDITLPGSIHMNTGETVDGVDISELGATSAALTTQVNANTSNIAGNTTNIAGNTSAIGDNATDISALEAEQITQNSAISANTTATGVNATDIATLEAEQTTQNTNIAANTSDVTDLETLSGNGDFTGAEYISFGSSLTNAILALDTQIEQNETDIATNATNITTLSGANTALEARVTTNEGDISTLQTEQGTQNTAIAANTTATTNNAADITALEAEQTTQNTNISTNATDISALEAEQIVQNGEIDDLETLAGTGVYTGAEYISFGDSLTDAVLALDAQIKTNEDDITALQGASTALQTQVNTNTTNIAGNTTDIATNATDITALEAGQAVQDTNIATNTTDITALEAGQLVQDNNIATNADDIDDIETWMAEEKPEKYQVPLGSVTVREDGSNNIVNIFRGTETGANPHHYNKVISSQAVLQDIETEYEILISEDARSFGKLIFSYKNDGGAVDSKFDIVAKDAAGNVIDSQIGVNSSAWNTDALDISSATANGGEFIYLTITSYSRNDRGSYFGDIYLDYGEER